MFFYIAALVLISGFFVTTYFNYEKSKDRHHLAWFVVSVLSCFGPLFVINLINDWYITSWYVGVVAGLTFANHNFYNTKKETPKDTMKGEDKELS